jgi:glycolate oxidase FAD binding subunit
LPSVCEPGSVAEAAEALRGAARVSIERHGGDVVLSTRRLDHVLEHEPGDLTCIVEAGIRLSALDDALAPHGQMLALDPPGDPTVGACVAGALSGPSSHRYGTIRDLVLGVTVVLADGSIGSSGGKVVKNVAGYDLAKLFCGSRGRLGLVARVALRLHPRPRERRTLVASVDDAERAWRSLHRSQLEPAAVDLLGPDRLAIRFDGGNAAVAAQLETARALVGGEEDGGVWHEVAKRQLAARARVRVDRLEGPLVRVRQRVAYVDEPVERRWSPVAERIRAAFDPEGKLA